MRAPPPIDLEGLAEKLGVEIRCRDLGTDAGKIERTVVNGEAVYIITVNNLDVPVRQRFTLAHELSHYIKHRHLLESGTISDSAMYRSFIPEPMEWEANRYAAQLLMPLSVMQKLWNSGLRSPAEFATHLAVSEQAAAIRLQQLQGSLQLGSTR